MLPLRVVIASLIVTVVDSASIKILPSEEVQAEQIVRTIETSRTKVKRAIISKLFKDYPSIVTEHLIQSQLIPFQRDVDNTEDSTSRVNSMKPVSYLSAVSRKVGRPHSPLFLMNINPTVKVEIQSDSLSEDITVALMPDMSTYDSINAAKNLYSHQNRAALLNPFSVSLSVLRAKRCAIIDSIGGITGTWNVKVKSHRGQTLHNDICIPRRSLMEMRPGYSITLTKISSSTNGQG